MIGTVWLLIILSSPSSVSVLKFEEEGLCKAAKKVIEQTIQNSGVASQTALLSCEEVASGG